MNWTDLQSALRDEGYDHDSARHFVAGEIDLKLEEWGASRFLADDDQSAE